MEEKYKMCLLDTLLQFRHKTNKFRFIKKLYVSFASHKICMQFIAQIYLLLLEACTATDFMLVIKRHLNTLHY
jgi:hypothetical protein